MDSRQRILCTIAGEPVDRPPIAPFLHVNFIKEHRRSQAIDPVAETIAYVTQGITLEPGDIVFTGTPSGVGHARKPNPVWMKPGDVCEIDIEGVGVLVNPIAGEK